ncbi:MAG: cytochrome P450 [Actinobacteria bacterium]|nr:cytochrome P450 [Actinomycetota bacterium]
MATIQNPQPTQVYDTQARSKLARESVKALDIKQPRGIPRPAGPNGAGVVIRQFLSGSMGPDFFSDLAAEYPEVAHWSILGRHLYVINDAALIDEVHRVHARELVKSRALMEAKVLLGNGLLTNEGADHLRQRRLVQPAFHRDRIREYASRMVAATVEHEKTWTPGASVDMAADMSALTLDVVGRTLFSADLRGDAAEVGDSLNVLLEAFPKLMLPGGQLIARIPGTGLHALPAELDGLDQVVQRMIDEHRELGDTGDLLSMLISAQEDGRGMSDAQLRDEVMTLVLAGHETTAMTLTWTWYLLSCYPAEFERLREELLRVLPDGRAPSFDDLANLPRTRAVILESMRLYPPAWIIGRSTTAELEVAGWRLPPGSIVLTSQYAMHRSPRYWDSALTFRPDRWLDEDGQCDERNPGQPKGAWFPFGYGKRKCIGDQFALTEAGLVLATLAARWHPELVPGTPIEGLGAVTLRPKHGMPMTLQPA